MLKASVISVFLSIDTGQLGCTPIPDDGDEKALQEAILSVLVSIFTSLPPSPAQDLFEALYRAYPLPLSYTERNKLEYDALCLLDQATCTPPTASPSILPWCATMDQSHELPFEAEDGSAEVLLLQKACGLKFAVSSFHVEFLRKLLRHLQAARTNPLVVLQLRLLYYQARNCRVYNQYSTDISKSKLRVLHSIGPTSRSMRHTTLTIDETQYDSSEDYTKAVHYLSNVWKYCLSPQQVMEVASHAVKHNSTPPPCISTLILSVIDCCPESLVMGALGMLAEGTPEQFLDGFENVLKPHSQPNSTGCSSSSSSLSHWMQSPRYLCQLLQLVGKVYNKVIANAVSDVIYGCQQRLKLAASSIAASMQLYESSQQFNQFNLSCQTASFDTLHIGLIAKVTCDAGQDAVLGVAHLLQFHPSFIDKLKRLCAAFYNVSASSVASSGLLRQHPFWTVIFQAVEARKTYVRNIVSTRPSDSERIDNAMKAFQAFASDCGCEAEFRNFASEMAALCPYNVRRMIEKRYLGIIYARHRRYNHHC